MTTITAPARPASRPAALRLLPAVGTGYVLAWLAGLVSAPAAPGNDASAGTVRSYFAAHGGAATVQALLVHGIAGLALVALTVGFARAARPSRLTSAVLGSGLAAASVSLAQFGFAVAAVTGVRTSDAGTTAAWFHAINYADTAKLVLLAVFAGTVTVAARHWLPGWLCSTGRVLPALLVLGGLEFLVDNVALNAALTLSLVVLLVWAGGTAWKLARV